MSIFVAVSLACPAAGVRGDGSVELGRRYNITPELGIGLLVPHGISWNIVGDLEQACDGRRGGSVASHVVEIVRAVNSTTGGHLLAQAGEEALSASIDRCQDGNSLGLSPDHRDRGVRALSRDEFDLDDGSG